MKRATEGLHVAVDGVGAKHGGAATVLKAIATASSGVDDIRRLTLFTSPPETRHFDLPSPGKFEEISFPDAQGIQRIQWLLSGLPHAARRVGADALLCLGNGGVAPRGIPAVVFLQQSIPFEPKAVRLLGVRERIRVASIRAVMRWSCRRARSTIVQSPTMKAWVGARFHIPEHRIAVVPPSASAALKGDPFSAPPAMQAADQGSRVLYVGSTRPHKNLPVLLEAVTRLRSQGFPLTLFLTCPPDHPICSRPGVTGIGYLEEAALWGAYRRADVLVLPSIVETVGLPLLEAASQGVPVLAADRPYAHDTCGDAAVFFDPDDPGDLAGKLLHLLSSPEEHAEMRRRGIRHAMHLSSSRPYEAMLHHVVGVARGETLDR